MHQATLSLVGNATSLSSFVTLLKIVRSEGVLVKLFILHLYWNAHSTKFLLSIKPILKNKESLINVGTYWKLLTLKTLQVSPSCLLQAIGLYLIFSKNNNWILKCMNIIVTTYILPSIHIHLILLLNFNILTI
jgi:hypothetical protein